MSRPVVALLTDFGTTDHYSGTMKGVVLNICPDANVVDISHDVPVHDVMTASLELAASYKYFPSGTVFLVVVDPGVGSGRRALAADIGGYRFVAPDNGVMTHVFRERAPQLVVELTERRYERSTVSRTFEGRDRFAPTAAWIANGVQVSAFGPQFGDYQLLESSEPLVENDQIIGEVLRIDRFGNIITNIGRKMFDRIAERGSLQIEIGNERIRRVVDTYSDIRGDEVCGLFGSTERLEFSANAESAAERLSVASGVSVVVRRRD